MSENTFRSWSGRLAVILALSPADCKQILEIRADLTAFQANEAEGEEVLRLLRLRPIEWFPSQRIPKLLELFREARRNLNPTPRYESLPSGPPLKVAETEAELMAKLMADWEQKKITLRQADKALADFRKEKAKQKKAEEEAPGFIPF